MNLYVYIFFVVFFTVDVNGSMLGEQERRGEEEEEEEEDREDEGERGSQAGDGAYCGFLLSVFSKNSSNFKVVEFDEQGEFVCLFLYLSLCHLCIAGG